MQRYFLSQKNLKIFINQIKDKYGVDIKTDKVEIGKEKKQVYYFIDGKLSFFSDDLIPTLCWVIDNKVDLPYVTVDEGATKALSRGADLFVPGITSFNCNCKPDDIILARTTSGIPVAIMKVLITKDEAIANKKGKFSQNIHWIGDEIWKMCKNLK
jgi:PUA-domain protein